MRIQCTQCSRTHDFAGRPPGTRAYCRCGVAVELPGRAATAVRDPGCPRCGGTIDPRRGECLHCGTSFVAIRCPHCFAMGFTNDRHCGQCGHSLRAPARHTHRNGHDQLPCPRCDGALDALLLDRFAVDGCARCGGLFLAQSTLVHLLEHRRDYSHIAKALRSGSGGRGDPRPGPCPVCDEVMQQRHHARRTFVVVDVCDEHGIWLDGNELSLILESMPGRRRRSGSRRGDAGARRDAAARGAAAATPFWQDMLDELIGTIRELLDEPD